MKIIFNIVLFVYLSSLLVSSRENIINDPVIVKDTKLYAKISKRDVVIFVEKFDLKTGKILKQTFLKGRGKVPDSVTSIMPLMDRKIFKNDKYIYAYDKKKAERGGYTLLMVDKDKVESNNNIITIESFIESFKQVQK